MNIKRTFAEKCFIHALDADDGGFGCATEAFGAVLPTSVLITCLNRIIFRADCSRSISRYSGARLDKKEQIINAKS